MMNQLELENAKISRSKIHKEIEETKEKLSELYREERRLYELINGVKKEKLSCGCYYEWKTTSEIAIKLKDDSFNNIRILVVNAACEIHNPQEEEEEDE